jgi:hypothetical protein
VSQVSEILDHYGLVPLDGGAKVDTISNAKVNEISEAIRQAVRYDVDNRPQGSPSSLEPFRFLAGSSVRGDSGCSRPECRLEKVKAFVRYAALYCDEVYVPLHLSSSHGDDNARHHLKNCVLTLNASRSLIEAGILRPIIPSVCRSCFETAPAFISVREAADKLAGQHLEEFKIYARGLLDGKAVIRTEGPTDFLEHGTLMTIFGRMPEWYPEESRKGFTELPTEVPLDRSQISSSGQVHRIFREIAMDVIAQILYSKRMHCGLTYLMGRPGEVEFLSQTKQGREEALRTAAIAEKLSHEVPVFAEAPIESIIELRMQDRDAFVMYRDAVKRIIRDHLVGGGGVTAEDARQLYGDVLAPRLAKLRVESQAYRRSLRRKSLLKAGASTALLTIGVVSGVLPTQIADIVKAVGGFSVAKEIVESVFAVKETSADVRSDDLYFLLRLAEQPSS